MPLIRRADLLQASTLSWHQLDGENLSMRMSDSTQVSFSRSSITSKNSYDSSSTSPTVSPRLQLGYEGGLMGESLRPVLAQPPLRHPGSHFSHNSYNHPYHSSSNSPSVPETELKSLTRSSNGASVTHRLSSADIHVQKRAYRQRRKDPSCDACRDRKVKCDATEMTSCSECSSRNVKCQFTKETNRRMSSIKQVQDMEKQIAQIKRENFQLRSMLRISDEKIGIDSTRLQQSPLLLPRVGSQPRKRLRPFLLQEFSSTRSNIHKYGRGIFKPPTSRRQTSTPAHPTQSQLDLPPKHISDQLLQSYYGSIHLTMPIINWPTFQHEYETVYKAGNLYGVSPVWTSLFFAALAVGILFCAEQFSRSPQKAREYIDISRMLTDSLNDEYVIDHARVAILTSIFLMEVNLKSAAWVWTASAIRISQDIGLHSENYSWPALESEVRRKLWWAIYIWDRNLSLELGRPPLIEDAECGVSLPIAIDDLYERGVEIMGPNGAIPSTNMILPVIHVTRAVSRLIKSLRSPAISEPTLRAFDAHFSTCMTAFPPFLINSDKPLDPRVLFPIFHLMNARLILHRHNLTIACPSQTRANSLEQCIRASLDSSFLIARAIAWPNPSQSFGPAAHAMTCMHIWRCTLFLLYGGHFDAALVCVQASSSIGTLRDVNICCGRNVAFFLNILIEKRRSGGLAGSSEYRDQRLLDEELMAYVSGDLQSHPENSWVWQSSENGINEAGGYERDGILSGISLREPGSIGEGILSEADTRDWGGWKKVEYLVGVLARESNARASPAHSRYALAPGAVRLKGNERMSITNII